jgi:signal transduction histidine kinase
MHESKLSSNPHCLHKIGGTGLGFCLCREIIHGFGGTISVMSMVGQGSVFSFTVQRAGQAGGAQPPL